MYGLTPLAIRVLGFAIDEYARREHLDTPEGETAEIAEERKLPSVVIGYVFAILLGLAFPGLAAAYFGIAVYLVVPFRQMSIGAELSLRNLCKNGAICGMLLSRPREVAE